MSKRSWSGSLRTWMALGVMVLGLQAGCASVGEQPQAGLPIGVVDPQRILQETLQGQRLTENLNKFLKDRQALVELEQRELRKLESELMAQSTVLSQQARTQKEEQFKQKMAEYQQKVADLNREVQEKQLELQNEFRREVQKVVSDIADRQGLSLVLEHGTNAGTLFYQTQLDISSQVIQALNRKEGGDTLP